MFSGIIPSIATILRIMNKPCTLTLMAVFTQMFLFDGITWILLFVYKLDGSYLMLVWIGSSVIFTIGTILPIVLSDWTKISDKIEILDNRIYEKIMKHTEKEGLKKIVEVN